MQVPGNWESRGLPDFDGVVWFTRTFDSSAGDVTGTLSLGPLRNTGEVWVNGQSLTPAPFVQPPAAPSPAVPASGARGGAPVAPAGGGRGGASATYALSAGVLQAGRNTITVRIQMAQRRRFLGAPGSDVSRGGPSRTPLAGTWKYRVERQTNAGALYTSRTACRARRVHRLKGAVPARRALHCRSAAPAPDVVVRLSVVPNQMKFDKVELNCRARTARRDCFAQIPT